MDAEEVLVVPDIQLVGGTEEALAKRKVIDGIEDVGLPSPVETHETVDVLRKQQVSRFAVLEVRQFQFVEVHVIIDFGTRDFGTRDKDSQSRVSQSRVN